MSLKFLKKTQDCCSDDDEMVSTGMNYITNDSKGQSRILSEFEELKFLGKGAFGDVLKVKYPKFLKN